MQRFLNWDFFSSFTKRNCFSLFFWTHEVGHLSCLKVSPLPWWPPPSFPDEKSCFLTHHYSRAVLLLASRTERSRSQAWIDRHACHSINPRIDILVKEDVIFGAFACQWPWENIYFVQTHWEPSDNETPELLYGEMCFWPNNRGSLFLPNPDEEKVCFADIWTPVWKVESGGLVLFSYSKA